MLRRKPKHNPVTPSLLAELIGWGYVTLTASLPPLDPPPRARQPCGRPEVSRQGKKMAAQGRGRVGGGKEERVSARSDSELLLHPELLSEEFLLLTLEQVCLSIARMRGGVVGGSPDPFLGEGGLRPCELLCLSCLFIYCILQVDSLSKLLLEVSRSFSLLSSFCITLHKNDSLGGRGGKGDCAL